MNVRNSLLRWKAMRHVSHGDEIPEPRGTSSCESLRNLRRSLTCVCNLLILFHMFHMGHYSAYPYVVGIAHEGRLEGLSLHPLNRSQNDSF